MNHYLRSLFMTVVGLLLVSALSAYLVDPYDYWNADRRAGFNEFKPAAGRHIVDMKIRQAQRVQPSTIVAGNSRVDVGFDPLSSVWPVEMQPVYNFGLPGKSAANVVNAIMKVIPEHRPEHIVLALDFLDFLISENNFSAMPRDEGSHVLKRLRTHGELLFSINAVSDSLATILEQRKRFPASWSEQGFNSLAEYHEIIASEGHRAIFDQRERQNLISYVDRRRSLGRSAAHHPELIALRKFLSDANSLGISVVLVIHPYHATILESFRASGLWSEFLRWKGWVSTLAEDQGIKLVDFAVYGHETLESVPEVGDTTTRLTYYWEAGHYKATLGDIVVNDILNASPMLGVELNSATLDNTFSLIEARAEEYERKYPDIVNRIKNLVTTLREN